MRTTTLFHPARLAADRACCAALDRGDDPDRAVVDRADLEALWEGRARMAGARLAAGLGLDDIDRQALEHRADRGVREHRQAVAAMAMRLTALASDLREVAAWLRDSWPAGVPVPYFAPVDPDREYGRVVLWVQCPDRPAMEQATTALGVRPAMLERPRGGYVTASHRVGRVVVEVWCRADTWRGELAA